MFLVFDIPNTKKYQLYEKEICLPSRVLGNTYYSNILCKTVLFTLYQIYSLLGMCWESICQLFAFLLLVHKRQLLADRVLKPPGGYVSSLADLTRPCPPGHPAGFGKLPRGEA